MNGGVLEWKAADPGVGAHLRFDRGPHRRTTLPASRRCTAIDNNRSVELARATSFPQFQQAREVAVHLVDGGEQWCQEHVGLLPVCE